jgi:uncharacterized SAM-binding protein YcdF (DUF218 family)
LGCGAGCVVVLLLALLVTLRGLWLPLIGGALIVADPLRPADAVVPLGGGERDRVTQAVALIRQGDAGWLIATDSEIDLPGIRDSWTDLVRREAVWQGTPAERIVAASGIVTTTYAEAQAVRRLMLDRGWRSLIVVTDPYHTRRARLIFRDVFRDSGVQVIVRPVEDAPYRADTWWRTEDGLRETWTEYLKMLLYGVGYR